MESSSVDMLHRGRKYSPVSVCPVLEARVGVCCCMCHAIVNGEGAQSMTFCGSVWESTPS